MPGLNVGGYRHLFRPRRACTADRQGDDARSEIGTETQANHEVRRLSLPAQSGTQAEEHDEKANAQSQDVPRNVRLRPSPARLGITV